MYKNPLLLTDSYKMGHMTMYPDDVTEVYSYLEARKPNLRTVFFGLQYILKEYLNTPIRAHHYSEFRAYYTSIMGHEMPEDMCQKLRELTTLGYWPLEIRAIPEGSIIQTQNALMTIRNTLPGFHWCVGFVESLLLKIWYPISVASKSLYYRQIAEEYWESTCLNNDGLDFAVHDFGYRGVSSEESAMIGGAAHLLSFKGSDTIVANKFIEEYYQASDRLLWAGGNSVPASEHSVMCAYGESNELDAFKDILKKYPHGIISIVSDTYNLWRVLTEYAEELKPLIMAREGKVVFRPDSGQPVDIICGNIEAPDGSPERKGALTLLDEVFGSSVNELGFKELNPKVGLIYGDGMFPQRYVDMLKTMMDKGWAANNLVIGVGGLLLQQHNRDDFGFAIKATRVVRNGKPINIYKDPITDKGKRSKRGLVATFRAKSPNSQIVEDPIVYRTVDEASEHAANNCELIPVFRDGKVLCEYSFDEIRARLRDHYYG